MIRFFTDPQNVVNNTITLSKDIREHMRSLRLRPDELFTVCDGNGTDYVCRLGKRDDNTTAEIIESFQSCGEPSVDCKVFIAYSKGERLDYAVQKSAELGASEIVLYESKRCVAVPNNIPKKIERLQRIALEAAKQSGRGIIPKVSDGGNFSKIMNTATDSSALVLFCYEDEHRLHLKTVLQQHFSSGINCQNNETESVIITGPEGGFEADEAEIAKSKGFSIISLGSRILRSETAPVVALTAVMYHTGNL